MVTKRISQECPDCHGTGLYSGMCEAKGDAVVCITCEGKGWIWHYYTPFTGRRKKTGIKKIRYSNGYMMAAGVGGFGEAMTYAEFEKTIPATKKK